MNADKPKHRHYSSYNCSPVEPNWIVKNARATPTKIKNAFDKPIRFKTATGYEEYKLKNITWDPTTPEYNLYQNTNPDMTGRSLKLTWSYKGPLGEQSTHTTEILGFPYPNDKGAYEYNGEEVYMTNKLVQKPGVFPVFTQGRQTGQKNPEFLWETPNATFLQNTQNLSIQLRKTTGEGKHKPITIPREHWQQFSEILESFRNKTGDKRPEKIFEFWQKKALEQKTSNPKKPLLKLLKIIQNGLGLHEETKNNSKIASFLNNLAIEEIPNKTKHTWLKYLETKNPEHAKTIQKTYKSKHWNFEAAQAAATIIEGTTKIQKKDGTPRIIPIKNFLGLGDNARLRMQTGNDVFVKYVEQHIKTAIQKTHNDHYNKIKTAHAFIKNQREQIIWKNKFNTATTTKELNNERNFLAPISTRDKILITLRTFAETSFKLEPESADIEREIHPSTLLFISHVTQENEDAGRNRALCNQTKVDNETGELKIPVKIKQNTTFKTTWITGEELTKILDENPNQGILLDKPENITNGEYRLYNMTKDRTYNNILTTKANIKEPKNIKIHFKGDQLDMFPQHLAAIDDVNKTDPSRNPMLKAGLIGAVPINGAQKPKNISQEALKNAKKNADIGGIYVSPITGKIIDIKPTKIDQEITIQSDDNKQCIMHVPRQKSNAFKSDTGTTVFCQINDIVQKKHVVAGPELYQDLLQNKTYQPVFVGTNFKTISTTIGNEDQMAISRAVVISGRLTKITTEKETTEHIGPIHLGSIHPGQMITPNTILAYQTIIENGEQRNVPILTSQNQGGILKRVTYVMSDNAKENLCNINIAPEKFTEEQKNEEIKKSATIQIKRAITAFEEYIQTLNNNPEYIKANQNLNRMTETQIKPTEFDLYKCLNTLTYKVNDKQKTINISNLSTNKNGQLDQITKDFTKHTNEIEIDPEKSYLNERFLYILKNIKRQKTYINDTKAIEKPNRPVNKVVFEIACETELTTGFKLSSTAGTKGVITINDFPVIFVDKTNKPHMAELAITTHAVVARGSTSQYDKKNLENVTPLQKGVLYDPKTKEAKITTVNPHNTYNSVQYSSPTTHNKTQGKGITQHNDTVKDGIRFSTEGLEFMKGAGLNAALEDQSQKIQTKNTLTL